MSRLTATALIGVVCLVVTFGACTRDITNVIHEQASPSSCFLCHSDVDTRLVANEKQWSNSRHASGLNTNRNFAPCSACHTSEGFIDDIAGVGAGTYPNATVIHCFTCHAPHSTGDFRLRVNSPQSLANGVSEDIQLGNMCVSCHVARRDVNTYVTGSVTLSSHWGPHHGTQADNLFGSNGYEYVGFTYLDNAAHRTVTQDGCLDCHLRTTRNFVVGGHSFNMRAVLPTEFETGGHEDFIEILNTAACTNCHGPLPDFDRNGVQTEIAGLSDSLLVILMTAGMVDSTGHPIGGVTVSADSAGALWNWLVVYEDHSLGVHNSRYMRSLLQSGIQFMEGSLPPQPSSGALTSPFAANKPRAIGLSE